MNLPSQGPPIEAESLKLDGPLVRPRGWIRDWLLPSPVEREWGFVLAGVMYIAVIAMLGGLRADHVFIGMLGCLDVYNARTRVFLRTFLPCIVTGMIFDSMRYFSWPAIEGRVHVAAPYLLDRAWFGVGGQTLNEYFHAHHWVVADLLTGFAYLTFVAEFLGLAMFLFFRGFVREAAWFARTFLIVNVMGFITYFIYPAAPPWYAAKYGLGPVEHSVHPSAAAAHRFDDLLGTQVFAHAYDRSVVTFGAIPSLHSAYPLIAAILAFKLVPLRWARYPAVAFAMLMWFSAVYLQHHYVIDVILGIIYGAVAVALAAAWERRCSRS